jgi:NADH:ubiquinone oxidoreductase subunit F (NADH-binding)
MILSKRGSTDPSQSQKGAGLTMTVLRTGVYPGVTPRLMRTAPSGASPAWESRADYERTGGYQSLAGGLHGSALIDAVAASGLRGRGGAAFPLARKLAAVTAQPGEHVVLVNGEEGEPASVKDRWLLRTRPHLVLDGALLAARAVSARAVYVYVSDSAAAVSLDAAVAELGAGRGTGGRGGAGGGGGAGAGGDPLGDTSVRVFQVGPSYVAGEETAAVNAVNGHPAKPSDKPPRPFEEGVGGRPTLVSNAETIANLPAIAAQAVAGDTPSAGTFLLTLGGAVARPGLYEVPFGVTAGEITAAFGGVTAASGDAGGPAPAGYVMGGYFAGLVSARGGGLALDYDGLRAAGTGLGCGAVTVLGPGDCPVRAAALLLGYFGRENAGQCGACFNGTAAMAGVAAALGRGDARPADVGRLRGWSGFLPGRGACGTLDGAANVAASLLREFGADVESHLARGCPSCAETDFLAPARPFALVPDSITPGSISPDSTASRAEEAIA